MAPSDPVPSMTLDPSTTGRDGAQDLEVLAAWAPELAETFAALACDIALVVDVRGEIVKLARAPTASQDTSDWLGQLWITTASTHSQTKLQNLLAEVMLSGRSRRYEVSHGTGSGPPVAWRAARLGRDGPVLAVGHDLRPHAEMQQRFLAAQEALERSYWSAQRHLLASRAELPRMTPDERFKLGIADPVATDDAAAEAADALKLALDRLHERIGKDSLQGLLRDARRLAEQQFLTRALQRAGSLDALARSLGVSRRALLRRGGQALRQIKP